MTDTDIFVWGCLYGVNIFIPWPSKSNTYGLVDVLPNAQLEGTSFRTLARCRNVHGALGRAKIISDCRDSPFMSTRE